MIIKKFFKIPIIALSIVLIMHCIPQYGHTSDSDHHIELKKGKWSFSGIFGTFDYESINRGLHHYINTCSHCHSMNKLAYRNLLEIGLSEDSIKDIASAYTVTDGIDDAGAAIERSAIITDHFVAPFANVELAKIANNGAVPPDLSLIIKARPNGADYVYSLLTGYTSHEPDADHLYKNPFFLGGKLAMVPPLNEDILDDGETIDSAAKDIVNFLQWCAEPEMEYRKRLGLKTMLFLFVTFFISYKAYLLIWKDLKSKKSIK